jgi:NAD(P)-dependent dehydrogenase (short-subunit alcohol dehydrogenase family)/uncharacterized OB-fold protein/putative sterol carrier protein
MTVLYRKRDLLTGLVGGQCRECGTPQIPRSRVCVNPECGAVDSQEPYEFSARPASVKTYTADMLAVSFDPPHIYGMVQFEGGGRFIADFTDCELKDVKVGGPVKMVFRKRYDDQERGFSGYFWKAAPLPAAEAPGEAAETIRFDGRVAVVTGAGAGLGRVYALDLARRGAQVVVNDLGGARDGTGASTSAADQVVDEIKAAGGQAVANYDSVATPEGGENLIQAAIDAFGRVDIVINNAGILRDKTFVKMEPDNWNAVLDVHLNGAYHVTRPAFVRMRDQGYGRIILTTSAAGLYGNFGQTNYSAAKMALIGFMNSVKVEGDKYDVKINTVAPVAATRLTEDILPPDMLAKLKPEFVSPLVLFLSSDQCQESGNIINAGMGYFNRAAIGTGPGAVVGDGLAPPSLEDVHRNFSEIDDLSEFEEFPNAMASFDPMMNAFKPKKKAPAAAEELTVPVVFDGLASKFKPENAAGVEVVFQFDITGGGGGQWFAEVKDEACRVEPGRHEAPTTTLSMNADDFLKMVKGEITAMSAFTGGKLKISGDVMKSQLFEKLFSF